MAKNAIIADDDDNLRKGLAMFLLQAVKDANIMSVPNGESLVEKVRGGGYSLVMIDYDMGMGMSGADAIRAIRAFDPATPIYMLSGSDKHEEALKAGATGYISKGGNFAVLKAQLERIALQYLR